jgi:hypothetical protein
MTRMSRFAIAAGLALVLCSPVRAESVFLKSGPVVRGKIASENAAAITVTDDRGERRVIPRTDVLRVLYMDIYLGRMVVRLTDGRSFLAYLAFEDTESYTFRKEINRTEEFTVPRKQVLFMARSNPTDLECRGRRDSIVLSWNAPYRPPARYRIYIKEAGEKEYRAAGSSRWTRSVIRGLKNKTAYTVIVTAIDRDSTESLPSDERTATTNIPPSPPRFFMKRQAPDNGRPALALRWKNATDRDGTVTAYRVYARDDARYRLAGETPSTSFTLKDLEPGNRQFALRAVDDSGGESEEIRFGSRPVEPEIEARGLYLLPLARLARLAGAGYGASLTVSVAHDTLPPLAAGLGAGYCRFMSGSTLVRTAHMVPFYGRIQCRVRLGGPATLSPEFAAGASLVEITATSRRFLSFSGRGLQGRTIEPYVSAGAVLAFRVRDWLFLNVNADYSFLVEGRRCVDFISCGFGIAVRI